MNINNKHQVKCSYYIIDERNTLPHKPASDCRHNSHLCKSSLCHRRWQQVVNGGALPWFATLVVFSTLYSILQLLHPGILIADKVQSLVSSPEVAPTLDLCANCSRRADMAIRLLPHSNPEGLYISNQINPGHGSSR